MLELGETRRDDGTCSLLNLPEAYNPFASRGLPTYSLLQDEDQTGSQRSRSAQRPGVRAIFGWTLLSFEVRLLLNVRVGRADIGEMAKTWPKLRN